MYALFTKDCQLGIQADADVRSVLRANGWDFHGDHWEIAQTQTRSLRQAISETAEELRFLGHVCVVPADYDKSPVGDALPAESESENVIYEVNGLLSLHFAESAEVFNAVKSLGKWDEVLKKRLIDPIQSLQLLELAHTFDFIFSEEAASLVRKALEGLDVSEIPAILRDQVK